MKKQVPEAADFKLGVLKNFVNSTSVLESLFNKAAGLKVFNSIKKTRQHGCFPVKFTKFLRTSFFTEEF